MAIFKLMIQVPLLIINAIAILNEERFLAKSRLSYANFICYSRADRFKLDGFRRHARFVMFKTQAFNNHTTKLPMVLFQGGTLA